MSEPTVDYAELRWRCRRGMLELDILLNTYLDSHYKTMTGEQSALFSQMLDYPDQVLFDLLLGNMHSSDQNVNRLVTAIRQAQRVP